MSPATRSPGQRENRVNGDALWWLASWQDLKGVCGLSLLPQVGLPSGTWAFCLATLLFLLLTTKNPNIYKMPLSKVTYPEENRIFYLQVKKRIIESPLWEQTPSTAMVTSHFRSTALADFRGLCKLLFFTDNHIHTNPLAMFFCLFGSFCLDFRNNPKHVRDTARRSALAREF